MVVSLRFARPPPPQNHGSATALDYVPELFNFSRRLLEIDKHYWLKLCFSIENSYSLDYNFI